MGSLSTRRVIRRSAPSKITIVEGNGGANGSDEKENVLNCNLYSLFETHYEKSSSNKSSTKAGGDTKAKTNDKAHQQPRKRPLSDRTVPLASGNPRELTPPELTTSDTFKPAKRTLGLKRPGEEVPKQLLEIKTPEQSAGESCDVLVSSPTEVKKLKIPESKKLKTPEQKLSKTAKRDGARKTPTTQGRRFSILRLSIARDGGSLLNSKRDGSSSAKKSTSAAEQAKGELNGKEMVFSAKKRTSIAELSSRVQMEMEKARLRVLERRKSDSKPSPGGKKGIGSFGGRNEISKNVSSVNVSPMAKQPPNSSSKAMADGIRTRKLSMVLKSEQRLTEKNEQYIQQLRQLQDETEHKDRELERLRSVAVMLQNLINRQTEEIRELRFRLKETFNENSEVRDVCETLERELRQTREALRMTRMQQEPTKSFETQMVSLTSRLYSMAISPPTLESCIEEGQEEFEEQEDSNRELESEERFIGTQEVCDEKEVSAGEGILDRQDIECTSEEPKGPEQDMPSIETITRDQDSSELKDKEDTCYTLQDLQEMVMQEEDLLKERFANALKELNLPLSPLLNSKGALDVHSLKSTLEAISSRKDYLTEEKVGSIRRLTAWIGSSD